MAHWKYHLERGDLVHVNHNGNIGWGTVLGIIIPSNFDPGEAESYDDVPLEEFTVKVKSGQNEYEIPMNGLNDYTAEEDRETDLPMLSEGLRLTNGI